MQECVTLLSKEISVLTHTRNETFLFVLFCFQTGDLDIGGNWRPHPFDWIYQGPAVVVLVVNVIFLIIIMWVSKFLKLSWVIASLMSIYIYKLVHRGARTVREWLVTLRLINYCTLIHPILSGISAHFEFVNNLLVHQTGGQGERCF